MSYQIRKTNGEIIQVDDGQINNETNIKLLGRGVEDYGQYIAENLLRILENFSSPHAPGTEDSAISGTPLKGQLWYDSSEDILKYYDGEQFISLLSGNVIVEAANRLRFPRRISLSNDAVGSVLFDGSEDVNINVLVNKSLQAGKLSNPINLTLTGDVEGTVSFDGSQDVELPIQIINNGVKTILSFTGDGNSTFITEFSDSSTIEVDLSHKHDIDDINGLREELDSKVSLSDISNIQQNTVSVVSDIVGQLKRESSSLQERELKVLEILINGDTDNDRYLVIPSAKIYFDGNTQTNFGYIRVYVNYILYEEYTVIPNNVVDENGNLEQTLDTYTPNIKVDLPKTSQPYVVTMFIMSKRGDFGITINSKNEVLHLITPSDKLTVENISNPQNPTFNVTYDESSVDEGESVKFIVETTDFPDGVLYWTLSYGLNVTDSDFVGDTQGTVNITNGYGQWEVEIANDSPSEINETFAAQIRINSVNGPVVATSTNVTIRTQI